jgi:PAS domain S-box-containing protein
MATMMRTSGQSHFFVTPLIIGASIGLSLVILYSSTYFFGEGPPLIWFVPSVLLSSYFLGMTAGIVVSGLDALIASYSLLAPFQSFDIASHNDKVRLFAFVVIGCSISVVMELLHRARRKAVQADQERARICKELEIEISKRQAIEEELLKRESEQRFILSAIPAGVTYVDLNKTYRFCNQTFANWFQLEPEAIIGKCISDVVNLDHHRNLLQRYEDVFAGQHISFEEYRNFNDQGRHVRVDMIPDKDSFGQVRGCFVLQYDVTSHIVIEKKLEEAKQDADYANQAKSYFLANMSHEIRTPLSAILGFSELLCTSETTEAERLQWLGVISKNGELLNTIISDILDFSKIEAGKCEIDKSKVLLSEIVDDVRIVANLKEKDKGIALAFKNDSDLPIWIETDAPRLKQILLNIIGNAIKFTEEGQVEVSVRMTKTQDDSLKLGFFVKDTGCGMTAEQTTRLFLPFSQADRSITKKYGGTGLGLMLSRSLARKLGGDINLVSTNPNQGSLFAVTIDVGVVEQTSSFPRKAQTATKPQIGQYFNGLRILLAEDSKDIQLLMSRYLKNLGAEVFVANDGREAVTEAQHAHYDLILMDIQMPVMDGYEAILKLRRDGYKGRVFALTAHAMKDDNVKISSIGFDDYLTKPLDFQLLIQKVCSSYNSSMSNLIPIQAGSLASPQSAVH